MKGRCTEIGIFEVRIQSVYKGDPVHKGLHNSSLVSGMR